MAAFKYEQELRAVALSASSQRLLRCICQKILTGHCNPSVSPAEGGNSFYHFRGKKKKNTQDWRFSTTKKLTSG